MLCNNLDSCFEIHVFQDVCSYLLLLQKYTRFHFRCGRKGGRLLRKKKGTKFSQSEMLM
jgi:hypothetical protein